MKKYKVLVVYHYFALYRVPVMRELAKHSDIEFEFVSGSSSEINIEKAPEILSQIPVSEGGVNWSSVSNVWINSSPILWQKGLVKKCSFDKYDSIIFLGSPYFLSTWLGVLISRVRGKRVLFWTHGYIRDGGIKDSFRKLFFKLANGLLLYGNWAKSNLVKHGFTADKLFVINNSLDYDKHLKLRNTLNNDVFKKRKTELFGEANIPVLIFIGRLTPQKNLNMLLDLIFALKEKLKIVNLLFIGDGEVRGELSEQAVKLGISDQIVFYGACHDDDDLAPLIGMSDVCVSPGEVGLTAIHCMSLGTPVITHNDPSKQMPEFETIIEGRTGSLFERGDFAALVNTTETWLDSKSDRDFIRKECYSVIDSFYNPKFQVAEIIKALNI